MSKLATQIKKEKLIGTQRKRFVATRPFPKDFQAQVRKGHALTGPIKPKVTLDMTSDPKDISKKLRPIQNYIAAAIVEDSLENFDLDARARKFAKQKSFDSKDSRWSYQFEDGSGLMVDDGQLDNRVFVFVPGGLVKKQKLLTKAELDKVLKAADGRVNWETLGTPTQGYQFRVKGGSSFDDPETDEPFQWTGSAKEAMRQVKIANRFWEDRD